MKKLLLLFTLCTALLQAQYSTPGTGVVWGPDSLVARSNGTVTLNGSVYNINGLLTITASDAVIIPPGTQVVFTTTAAGIAVYGVFRAVGTEQSRITFTGATADSLGAYQGFQFFDTSVDSLCKIAFSNITYAYYGLRCSDASPSFHNNYVFKCRRGVQLSGSSPRVERNIIARSYEYGITMTLGSSPVIEFNDIYDNNTQNTSAKNQISIGTQGTNSPIVRFNKVHGSTNTKTGGISVSSLLGNISGGQIIGNEIYQNSFGIAVTGGVVTTIIADNYIHDNNINSDFNVSGSGINVNGSATNTPYIARNYIVNNHWGITVQNGTTIQAGPQPFLGNAASGNPLEQGFNVFRNNTHSGAKFDLFSNCTNDLLAQNNDWGAYDSLGIEERVTHKKDNSQLGLITFMPFSGSLQVRLLEPNGGESWRIGTQHTIRWFSIGVSKVKLEISYNSGSSWALMADTVSADSGRFTYTVYGIPSTECLIKITDVNNPNNTDVSDSLFTLIGGTCLDVTYAAGWNLVSVPLATGTFSGDSLFPGTTTPFYSYNNGYTPVSTLAPGKAYWQRFNANPLVTFCGFPFNFGSIALNAGWNLIGPYHLPLVVANLNTVPSGILNSSFYGYNNGYVVPAQLESGKGYWIRASQAGVLITQAPTNKVTPSVSDLPQGKIIITDANGASQTLFVTSADQCEQFVLPPAPPAGIFDARFTSDQGAIALQTSVQLAISNAVYPVTIQTEGTVVSVTDCVSGGKLLQGTVQPGKPVTIANPAVQLLQVTAETVPYTFALEQNYPNPFNPETKIAYSVPVSGRVHLEVFDILGSKIATLFSGTQTAGSYAVTFNAAHLPSGMYFYRLDAGSFHAVKKMMLIK